MAFQALSLSHDALKGTKGVQLNGYAADSVGIVARDAAQQAANDPTLSGTICSIVSQASTSIGGAATTSTGTAVTVADSTVFTVGDVVVDPGSGESREVVAIVDATTLTIGAAFTVDLAGVQLTAYDTVYHTSECVKNASFQGVFYFADSLNNDVPVLDEAVVVALS